MSDTLFAPWPSFTEEDAHAVSRVLLSNRVNYWTGTEGREFESEFAKWCNVPHAVALANGTLALELAFRALEIGEGDEAWRSHNADVITHCPVTGCRLSQ